MTVAYLVRSGKNWGRTTYQFGVTSDLEETKKSWEEDGNVPEILAEAFVGNYKDAIEKLERTFSEHFGECTYGFFYPNSEDVWEIVSLFEFALGVTVPKKHLYDGTGSSLRPETSWSALCVRDAWYRERPCAGARHPRSSSIKTYFCSTKIYDPRNICSCPFERPLHIEANRSAEKPDLG
ncbi:hypothetical protein A9K97_gp025 [Tokyovirus A1]|uniref:hypothetical protein n=1 Tax=Tokyovirus A1 TaxID=1826170 RepID=UPI0007A966F5|nr:hypothetical protein A9K97_gp025 [Tokyovirus A1]BAU80326.1 hypothetical protein [Tokyovirus A1]